jgi:hypothetical protein
MAKKQNVSKCLPTKIVRKFYFFYRQPGVRFNGVPKWYKRISHKTTVSNDG